MGTMNHVYDHRFVYENAKQMLRDLGVNADSAKLTQGYLRFELIAQVGVSTYQFAVLNNQTGSPVPAGGNGATRANEVRLNLQDAFIASGMQFVLGLATSTDDTAFPVFSWNNPNTFAGGADLPLNNIYNGALSLTVNNDVITTKWDMLRHKVINQTQLTAATNSPVDQFDGGNDGMYPVEPNWSFIGSKNNVLTLTLPAAISALTAEATTVLVLIFRGVLAQNVTVVS